jgi:hypothetical protein
MFGASADDAGAEMACQQFQSQGVQGGTNGRYLVENFDTVPLFIDHASNTGNLSGHAIDASCDFLT